MGDRENRQRFRSAYEKLRKDEDPVQDDAGDAGSAARSMRPRDTSRDEPGAPGGWYTDDPDVRDERARKANASVRHQRFMDLMRKK